mgnify:FL=1
MSSDEAYNKNNISQFVPQLFQGMSFLGFPQNIRYPVLLTLKHFTFQLAKGRKKTAKTSIKQLGHQRADMLMLKRSTSRDETAIGQLRISVLLHEARTVEVGTWYTDLVQFMSVWKYPRILVHYVPIRWSPKAARRNWKGAQNSLLFRSFFAMITSKISMEFVQDDCLFVKCRHFSFFHRSLWSLR